MTGRCCGCGAYSTPSPRDTRVRRLEPSGSSGKQHRRGDSLTYTPLEQNRWRRQSKALFDESYFVEHYVSVETIHEERSNRDPSANEDMGHGRYASIDRALKNMQSTRRAMEAGIEEMRCQIYQIKFCNSKFKHQCVERHRLLDTMSTSYEQSIHDQKRPECIPSARDTLYESSRSGTENGVDDSVLDVHRNGGCASDDVDFVSPIPTPNPPEKQEDVLMQHPSINNPSNNYEVGDRPASPSVTRHLREPTKSVTESFQDVTESLENTGMGMDTEMTPSPRMRNYPTKGFKTDVVLNLHGHSEPSQKREHCKKGSGLNKLVDMFSKARRGRRLMQTMSFTQSASPRLQSNRKAKTQRRWMGRISGLQRNDMSSLACKFTEKYPIDASRWGRMQCFSPVHKGSQVMLDAEGTVAASRGEETSFVLCAEGVTSGVACFDLECQFLNDWCFIGVVSKKNVLRHGGPISESQMSYGWSNWKERFKNGVPSPDSTLKGLTSGTLLQV